MAHLIGKLTSNATKGERKFYDLMETWLTQQKDVVCYYEPWLGELHPDFLLLGPNLGVIIVELKDYRPKGLKDTPRTGLWTKIEEKPFEIQPETEKQNLIDIPKIVEISNPFDQIWDYYCNVLMRIDNSHLPTEIKVPVYQLVGLTEIERDSDLGKQIVPLVPVKITILFKDDFKVDKLDQIFHGLMTTRCHLTESQFNVIRANLIPNSRLPQKNQKKLTEFLTEADRIKLMDYEQEKLARELGDGHRLVFGVAGSGKTIVLIARIRYLAQKHPTWKILVLCYNKLLRQLLYQLIVPQDFEANIQVETFHTWIKNFIMSQEIVDPDTGHNFAQLYQIAFDHAKKTNKIDLFFKETVLRIYTRLLQHTTHPQYDAILIDEAQDFEADWFRIVVPCLNLAYNSLYIACDGLQGIYARKNFHWSDVGINARGRVKKFTKSYRNPKEVGQYAFAILPHSILEQIDQREECMKTEEFAGIPGIVELLVYDSRQEEYQRLVEKINAYLHADPDALFLVIFRRNMKNIDYQHPFLDSLTQAHINWHDFNMHGLSTSGILIGTPQATKGLEADAVFIPELDAYNSDEERQLLYVAMTRSKHKLILSASKRTELIKNLEAIKISPVNGTSCASNAEESDSTKDSVRETPSNANPK